MAKGEWASWAQAVGSVFAIGASFWLGRQQYVSALRVEEKRHAIARRHRFQAILGLYEEVQRPIDAHLLGLAEFAVATPPHNDSLGVGVHMVRIVHFNRENVITLDRYLEAIDPIEFGDAAPAILHLRTSVGRMLECMKGTADATTAPEIYPWPKSQAAAKKLVEAIGFGAVRLVNACRALGFEQPQWISLQLSRVTESQRQYLR